MNSAQQLAHEELEESRKQAKAAAGTTGERAALERLIASLRVKRVVDDISAERAEKAGKGAVPFAKEGAQELEVEKEGGEKRGDGPGSGRAEGEDASSEGHTTPSAVVNVEEDEDAWTDVSDDLDDAAAPPAQDKTATSGKCLDDMLVGPFYGKGKRLMDKVMASQHDLTEEEFVALVGHAMKLSNAYLRVRIKAEAEQGDAK